jgi:hypothetical protein
VNFYSARLLFVVLVDDGLPRKTHTWDESVVIFRARDFDHAFTRALEIGRSHETEYLNRHSRMVRWALVGIENLDFVGKRVDGAEVASRLNRRRSKQSIPFATKFRPQASKPSQSFS